MKTPVLHVLAGPNGSGKSTFAAEALEPVTHLPFVNARVIASQRWPGDEARHAYEAAQAAADVREAAIAAHASLTTETVFSHPSKVDLVQRALRAGYRVELHVMLMPEELAVHRVAYRVRQGGHTVPEHKIRERYRRLWTLVGEAQRAAHKTTFYDNTRAGRPFVPVAVYRRGRPVGEPAWPAWTPPELLAAL